MNKKTRLLGLFFYILLIHKSFFNKKRVFKKGFSHLFTEIFIKKYFCEKTARIQKMLDIKILESKLIKFVRKLYIFLRGKAHF